MSSPKSTPACTRPVYALQRLVTRRARNWPTTFSRSFITALAPYVLPPTQEIQAIRAFRSLAHGFVLLELAGGFGLPIDLDESYRTLMDLLVRVLERLTAT